MDETIQLTCRWRRGERIAAGGFANVYAAEGEDGASVVIKMIPKTPGASRELLFDQIAGVPNVIPILDSGELTDHYVLVMPRAERSLRQRLDEANGPMPFDEAIGILIDIAGALAGLESGVVHRDLKPENVLLYQGRWCLCDFGIARYADAATSPDTRKYAMTPAYAAPEQWRGERATSATDVYAFGVIAFELFEGTRAFLGAEASDFREQHLNSTPPALTHCPTAIASLISECLYKAAAARPLATSLVARLRAGLAAASPATERLRDVNRSIVEREAAHSAAASAQQTESERRAELFAAATQSFARLLDMLRVRIVDAAPSAQAISTSGLEVRLGAASLAVAAPKVAPAGCLAIFEYAPAFDVIAYSWIAARKPRDRYDYEGRSHSLWFCDAHQVGVYRWYELAFMVSFIPQRFTLDPFALRPTDEQAAAAFAPVTDVRQVAWAPLPFDQGDEERFLERWIGWLAAAADGSLSRPSHMPENSGGTYRSPVQRRG